MSFCKTVCKSNNPERPVNFWATDLTPQLFDSLLVEPGSFLGISPGQFRANILDPIVGRPCPTNKLIFNPLNTKFFIPN